MDIGEAIRALLGVEDRTAVIAALQKDGRELYQAIFNKGHATATEKLEQRITALTEQVSTAQAEATAAKTALADAEKNKPDVTTIRQQYEQQITDLKERHKAEIGKEREGRKAERLERTKGELKRALVIDHGIDKDYAEVLVERADVRARLTFSDKGDLEILQAGKTIPIVVGDGQNAVGLFAEELKGGVDPKWVTSKADNGTGGQRDQPGGSGGDLYEQIRAEAKPAQQPAQPPVNGGPPASAAARMGMGMR